jgi:hypothetical protein
MSVVIDLDWGGILAEFDKELGLMESRTNNLNAVTSEVLREMESQNKRGLNFFLNHPDSTSGFIKPASWFIGSKSPKYAGALWSDRPEFVFDIVLRYILTGSGRVQ